MNDEITDESRERKARSIAILKLKNIPTIDHLPFTDSVATSTRRTTEEVAVRAMALCLVAAKGEGLDQIHVEQFMTEYSIEGDLSPRERAFIGDAAPSEHDRVQFVWRYECFWVMLWALGYVTNVGYPEKTCDVTASVKMLVDRGRDRFIAEARMRSQAELLDEADLTYRYHWATVEARMKKREMPGVLDSGVVMERDYALTWLTSGDKDEWDDIQIDT